MRLGPILTINAAWCWAIMQGHKRLENRTWRTKHQGRLWLHAASRSLDPQALELFERLGIAFNPLDLEALRGKLVGSVDLVACVPVDEPGLDFEGFNGDLEGHFATGPFCWLLRDFEACELLATKGKQGLYWMEVP